MIYTVMQYFSFRKEYFKWGW